MQIVIDIDKNLYTRLFDNGVDNYDDAVDMAKAIRKGTPLGKIRAEIYQLHYHPKLDFIKNDEVVEMAIEIIDKYKGVRE